MLETYQHLLTAFAAHVGLDPQSLAETQEVTVGDLAIGLAFEGDEHEGDLVYFADLGTPPDHLGTQVHRTLLEANHFWAGTGGATLSLQPETGAVVCCGRTPLGPLDAQGVAALLQVFHELAMFWRSFVTGNLPPPDPPVADPRVYS